jgi:zinc D-Ala-D-Ala carboxypeptidase
MMLSEYFSLNEMTRSQTASRLGIDNTPGDSEVESLRFLCVNVLDPIRKHFGVPFSPSSGYRCEELNKAIGSSPNSQHCKGEAADIEIPGVPNLQLSWWIRAHLDFDQLILEYYNVGDPAGGWVHVSSKKNTKENASNRREVMTYDGKTYNVGLPG